MVRAYIFGDGRRNNTLRYFGYIEIHTNLDVDDANIMHEWW